MSFILFTCCHCATSIFQYVDLAHTCVLFNVDVTVPSLSRLECNGVFYLDFVVLVDN